MPDTNFSLGIVIGATISNSIGSAFKTIENKFKSLEQKSQNLKLTKAYANKFKAYENTIKNLQKQREEYQKLGKATDEIDRKLEVYKQKLKGVKLEAIKAGISIRDLKQDTQKLGKTLDEVKRKMKLGEISGKVATQTAKFGAVATTGFLTISSVIKPAIDFESAFADVKKVVDFANKEQEKQFQKTLLNLSTKIPLSAVELAQISAQGGQLGIKVEDLPQFTQLVAKMATAFDMVPEQAGESFAKLSNVYNLSMKEAEELGDAINALGNNTAAKERDIINTLGRIGGIAKQFGLMKEGAAALSAAFIALGKPPEVAATAINALLGKLDTVATQSPAFQKAFSQVMPIEDFKRLQKEDPEKALLNFLDRLKQLDKETRKNLIAQMFGTEYADDVALLIESFDQYAKALDIVSDKSKYQGALQKEFEARSKTTENNLKLLQNRLAKIAITIGSILLPPFNKFLGLISSGLDTIAKFIEEHQTLGKVIAFGSVAIFGFISAGLAMSVMIGIGRMAVLGLSGSLKGLWQSSLIAGKGLLFVGRTATAGLIKGFGIARTAVLGLSAVLRTAFMLNPIGAVITAVLAIGTAGYMVIKHWDKVKAFFTNLWNYLKKGFSMIGKILEYSPIGLALKAGKWLWNKFTQKEEKTNTKKEVLQKTIKKIIKQEKVFKIDFSQLKINVSGEVKGDNIDENKLANLISKQLEEKLNIKIKQALTQLLEDEMRRVY